MPVRSFGTAVLRWPRPREVRAALKAWAGDVASRHPEVLRVGYIGSYARGDWGVGSDVDIVIVVSCSGEPFERRLPDVTATALPVPADILVYLEAELERMRAQGRRFARAIDTEAQWVFLRAPGDGSQAGEHAAGTAVLCGLDSPHT